MPTESYGSSRVGGQHTRHQHHHRHDPHIVYEPAIYQPVLEVHRARPQINKSSLWKPSTWSCNRKHPERDRHEEQREREREYSQDILRFPLANTQPVIELPIHQPHAAVVTQPAAYVQPYTGALHSHVYQQPGYPPLTYQNPPAIPFPAPVLTSAPAVQRRGDNGESTYILPDNSKITFRRTFVTYPTQHHTALHPIAEAPRQVSFVPTPQPVAAQQATTPQVIPTRPTGIAALVAPIFTTKQPIINARYAFPPRGPAYPDQHYPLVERALNAMWGCQDANTSIEEWRDNAAARMAERERRSAKCGCERV